MSDLPHPPGRGLPPGIPIGELGNLIGDDDLTRMGFEELGRLNALRERACGSKVDDVLSGKIVVREVIMADGQVGLLYGLSPLRDLLMFYATLDEIEAKITELESDRDRRDTDRRGRKLA